MSKNDQKNKRHYVCTYSFLINQRCFFFYFLNGRYFSNCLTITSDNGVINNQLVVIRVKEIEPTNISEAQCAPAITRGNANTTVISSAHKKARNER